jgi:hypothetical protein
LLDLLHAEAPDLVPRVVTFDALEAAVQELLLRHRLAQKTREEKAWRDWFARLPPARRKAIADKAQQAGLSNPESFEAAWGVVLGEHAASLLTPEELAVGDEEPWTALEDFERSFLSERGAR